AGDRPVPRPAALARFPPARRGGEPEGHSGEARALHHQADVGHVLAPAAGDAGPRGAATRPASRLIGYTVATLPRFSTWRESTEKPANLDGLRASERATGQI